MVFDPEKVVNKMKLEFLPNQKEKKNVILCMMKWSYFWSWVLWMSHLTVNLDNIYLWVMKQMLQS